MSRVVARKASIPVFSAKAIQISGTSTHYRSRQAISTRHSIWMLLVERAKGLPNSSDSSPKPQRRADFDTIAHL
jgi:hypothetical protein